MSRCSCCAHPDRSALDAALGSGVPLRTIAERFGVSKTALLRHRDNHLAETLHPVSNPAASVWVRQRPATAQEPATLSLPPGEVPGGVSGAPAPAPVAEIDPLVSLTIQQQRIRQSLMLRQRGLSRAQVARALEVSERTITDWWAKAREESIAQVREATAEVFLADLHTERGLRSNYLHHMLDKAREKGDIKTQLSVLKMLETMDRTNITLAASLGTFHDFKPGAPSDHNCSNAGLSIMQDAFKEMAAIFSAYPDDPVTDLGDDLSIH